MNEYVRLMGHGDVDPAIVLMALYNHSRPLGMGMINFQPGNMTLDEAKEIISGIAPSHRYFDYFKGRVIKIDLNPGAALDFRLFDRDNGAGAGMTAVMEVLTSPADPHGTSFATGG
jgi:hypothetical protein